MLAWTVMFFHTGTFAIIKETSWTLTARFTLCGVLKRWTVHSKIVYLITVKNSIQDEHIRSKDTIKKLTQSSLSRFKQVRAHCSPSSPVPTLEQLTYTFGEGHAVREVETDLIYTVSTQSLWWGHETNKMSNLLDKRSLQERQWSTPLVHRLEKDTKYMWKLKAKTSEEVCLNLINHKKYNQTTF